MPAGQHKNSLNNLRQFNKGQSGNPSGRTIRKPITDAYLKRAKHPLPKELRLKLNLPEKATYADALALGQFRKGITGDAAAAKEVREAIEGKATQRVEFSGDVPAGLGLLEALDQLREVYGLRIHDVTPEPAEALSLPAPLDHGSEPPQDRNES